MFILSFLRPTNHFQSVDFLTFYFKWFFASIKCAYVQGGHSSCKLLEPPGMQFASWKVPLQNVETPGSLFACDSSKTHLKRAQFCPILYGGIFLCFREHAYKFFSRPSPQTPIFWQLACSYFSSTLLIPCSI